VERAKEILMKRVDTEMVWFQDSLEQKDSELVQALRNQDGTAIEKNPDQADKIQHMSGRELATHITIIKGGG
jgi:hypothetical protein